LGSIQLVNKIAMADNDKPSHNINTSGNKKVDDSMYNPYTTDEDELKLYDCFVIVQGTKMPCSKYLLSRISKVFHARYTHWDNDHSKTQTSPCLDLEQEDEETVATVLDWIMNDLMYPDLGMPLDFDKLVRLMRFADKYQIQELTQCCIDIISEFTECVTSDIYNPVRDQSADGVWLTGVFPAELDRSNTLKLLKYMQETENTKFLLYKKLMSYAVIMDASIVVDADFLPIDLETICDIVKDWGQGYEERGLTTRVEAVIDIMDSADLKNQKVVDEIIRLIEHLFLKIELLRCNALSRGLLCIAPQWPAELLHSVAGIFKEEVEWLCIGNLAEQVLQLKEQIGKSSQNSQSSTVQAKQTPSQLVNKTDQK
jgi:hypothetical protein